MGSAISKAMVNMQVATSTGFDRMNEITDKTGLSLRELQLSASNTPKHFTLVAESLGMTKTELNNVMKSASDLENFAKIAGMTGGEFKQAFETDAVGALGAFINGLGGAEAAGDSAINMLQEMGISEVRLRDSLLRAGNASELFAGAIDTANNAWDENVALTNEAEERYKTFESRFAMFKNTLIDVGITIGDVLIPALSSILEKISGLIDWFGNLNPKIIEAGVVFAAVAAAVGLVVGPLLMFIGFIPQLVTGVKSMVTVFMALKKATLAMNAVMLANPMVLIVTAIIAAVALLAIVIYKHWDEIKAFTIAAWTAISDFFVGLWDSIKDAAVTGWNAISDFFVSLWKDTKKAFVDAWNNIKDAASAAWEAIKSVIIAVVSPIVDSVMKYFNAMKDGVATVMDGFKQYFQGVWDLIKNIFLGAVLLIIDVVTGNWKDLAKDSKAIFENIRKAMSDIWEGIKKIFSGSLDAIKGYWTTTWDTVKKAGETVWKAIKTFFATTWDAIKTKSSEVWNSIKSTITTVWDSVKTFFTTTWNFIKSIFTTVLPELYTTVKTNVTNMFNSVKEWFGKIPGTVSDLWGEAKAFLEGIDLYEIGQDIVQGLIKGIGSMVGSVVTAAKDIASNVKNAITDFLGIHSPSRVMMGVGENIGEGLVNGMKSELSGVAKMAQKLADAAVVESAQPRIAGYQTPRSGAGMVRSVSDSGVGLAGAGGVTVNQELHFHDHAISPSEAARKQKQATQQLAMEWR